MTSREPEAAELVKRLRALSRHEHTDLTIGDEAADRLEAITRELAEIDRLNDACAAQMNADLTSRATLAESALAEARQKLAEIAEVAGAPVLAAGGDPRDRSLPSRLLERLDHIANLAKDKTHG